MDSGLDITPAQWSIVSLLERFQADRLAKDWPAMRALLHPSSRLESLAAPGAVLSPSELIEAIKGATAHGIYTVKTWEIELLMAQVALAVGRVRYSAGAGGFTDESRVWVTSEDAGLIWRMRIFRQRAEAVDCLRTHGPSLGL